MAQKTKQILKSYFETGDIPTQGNYVNLIDSNLNLNETGTQILVGTLSSSFLEVENHITASGNISSSGNVYATGYHVGNRKLVFSSLTDTKGLSFGNGGDANLELTHITASGNISSSGTIRSNLLGIGGEKFAYLSSPNNFMIGQGGVSSLVLNHITASGNISSSNEIQADTFVVNNVSSLDNYGTQLRLGYNTTHTKISLGRTATTTQVAIEGNITASGNISASGHIYGNDTTLSGVLRTDTIRSFTSTAVGLTLVPNITASGNISSSGNILATIGVFNGAYINGQRILYNNDDITLPDTGLAVAGGHITASGNLKVDGSQVDFTNLPTSDPSVAGRLYRDGTDLKISLG